MFPVVEKLAEEYDGKVKIGKVNSDENSELAMKYAIMSIPSFLMFKNGEVVNSATGAIPEAALKNIIDGTL